MLGEAVNLIAHEVKNSLNGLRVGLDLILQADRLALETRHRQAVSGLRTEMERLSTFTTELLSFSKGVVPRPVPLDLVEFSARSPIFRALAPPISEWRSRLPPPRVPCRSAPTRRWSTS